MPKMLPLHHTCPPTTAALPCYQGYSHALLKGPFRSSKQYENRNHESCSHRTKHLKAVGTDIMLIHQYSILYSKIDSYQCRNSRYFCTSSTLRHGPTQITCKLLSKMESVFVRMIKSRKCERKGLVWLWQALGPVALSASPPQHSVWSIFCLA